MKNGIKVLLAAGFALIWMAFAIPEPVLAADTVQPHRHCDAGGNEIEFRLWTDPTCLPVDGGAWYLGTDVMLERDWTPAADTRLCLNGHILSSNTGCCLWVEDITLDLYDEPGSAVHYFRYYPGSAWTLAEDCGGENAVALGDFTLDGIADSGCIAIPGGLITGADMFVGLYCEEGRQARLNLFGGNIAGIRSDNNEPVSIGGDAGFTMYGGCIAGNLSPFGSILHNRSGSVSLLGGCITGNISSGAVVYCGVSASAAAAGNIDIHDNISEKGAVFAEDGDIAVGGCARISGNITSKGEVRNVCLNDGHQIILQSPEPEMRIGVTTQELPESNAPVRFSGAASEDVADCFFSDSENAAVRFRLSEDGEGALYLTVTGAAASIFGSGSVGLIASLTFAIAAGIVCAVILRKRKNANETK